VKKTAKSLFSLLGTVPDGVKGHNLTASDVSTTNFYREFVTASRGTC
jgi:hypothetical protein